MLGVSPQAGMSLGPYHLVQCLASEGGAEVYHARASLADGTSQDVALKVYLGAGDDPAVFEHLTRAMGPALACRHEAVVRTLELRTVDEVMVVAMELVDGVDLGNLLASMAGDGSRLSVGLALHVARGLLSGLDCFHSLRDPQGRALPVVHGNLHPGNVLLSQTGEVKIADFITSLMISAPGSTRRARAALYRSPEQATGDAVDHRTDLFSVGLLLHEALAGAPAYDADELEDPNELDDVICEADIVPLDEQVTGLPRELCEVVGRALSPDPGERFSTAREMLAAFEPLLRLPEVATARVALARLVSQVTPRVMAARQLELGARARAVEAAPAEPSQAPAAADLPPPMALVPPQTGPMPADPQPQWATAILPTGPQPAAGPGSADASAADRKTEVMAAPVAEGEYDGTEFLHCSELMQLLQQKDLQRTLAGQEPARECTLFWSAEDAFVVDNASQTQIFHWSPEEGRVEQAPGPGLAEAATDVSRRTETRAAPRAAWPRLVALVAAVCVLGLGAGGAVSYLWAPAPAPRVLELRAGAAPLTVGPWRLELLPRGKGGEGPLEVSVRLGHAREAPKQPGALFALRRGGSFAPPDFWSHRSAGERAVEVKLVFKEGAPSPQRLRFTTGGIPPVILLLRSEGAQKQKKRR